MDGGFTLKHTFTLVTQINRATTLRSLRNPKMVSPEQQPRLAHAGRTLNRLKSRRYCRDMLRKRKRTCIIERDVRGVKGLFESRQLHLTELEGAPRCFRTIAVPRARSPQSPPAKTEAAAFATRFETPKILLKDSGMVSCRGTFCKLGYGVYCGSRFVKRKCERAACGISSPIRPISVGGNGSV